MDAKVTRYPLTNLGIDDDKNLHVEVAIAGFGRDEIELELKGNRILIRGKKSESEDDNTIQYIQQHISKTDFERSIILHEDYVDGLITANIKNGILSIKVEPSAQQQKFITIE
jgi:molecular chaperone IbpA